MTLRDVSRRLSCKRNFRFTHVTADLAVTSRTRTVSNLLTVVRAGNLRDSRFQSGNRGITSGQTELQILGLGGERERERERQGD